MQIISCEALFLTCLFLSLSSETLFSSQRSKMIGSISPNPVQLTTVYPIHHADGTTINTTDLPFKLGPFDLQGYGAVPLDMLHNPSQVPTTTLFLSDACAWFCHGSWTITPTWLAVFSRSKQNGTMEVINLETGSELVEARCNLRLEDIASQNHKPGRILMNNLPDDGCALAPPYDYDLSHLGQNCILAVQHTRFACGDVVLGSRFFVFTTPCVTLTVFSRPFMISRSSIGVCILRHSLHWLVPL